MRKQNRLKLKPKKESMSYQILMAIPRNLVYIIAFVVLTAFSVMAYVVYTEKDLTSFLTYTVEVNMNFVVHPLYTHL